MHGVVFDILVGSEYRVGLAAVFPRSFQSVFAFTAFKLRRTRFVLRSGVAAPRVARRAKRGGPGSDHIKKIYAVVSVF